MLSTQDIPSAAGSCWKAALSHEPYDHHAHPWNRISFTLVGNTAPAIHLCPVTVWEAILCPGLPHFLRLIMAYQSQRLSPTPSRLHDTGRLTLSCECYEFDLSPGSITHLWVSFSDLRSRCGTLSVRRYHQMIGLPLNCASLSQTRDTRRGVEREVYWNFTGASGTDSFATLSQWT